LTSAPAVERFVAAEKPELSLIFCLPPKTGKATAADQAKLVLLLMAYAIQG
jgi:hypothetical protein